MTHSIIHRFRRPAKCFKRGEVTVSHVYPILEGLKVFIAAVLEDGAEEWIRIMFCLRNVSSKVSRQVVSSLFKRVFL
jgi:hypothetical protein